MTIREFWRDVKDRLTHPGERRHPDERWFDRGEFFGSDDEWDAWRRDREAYRSRPWPRDEGYDEYRERGIGAGRGVGGPEITSGFFEVTERGAGGFAGAEQPRERADFRGRGPQGYRRTDDRIREDVCEVLTEDEDLDASEIEVVVADGEVTLSGSVKSRTDKRYAEDLTANVSGVRDVHNTLRTELP